MHQVSYSEKATFLEGSKILDLLHYSGTFGEQRSPFQRGKRRKDLK